MFSNRYERGLTAAKNVLRQYKLVAGLAALAFAAAGCGGKDSVRPTGETAAAPSALERVVEAPVSRLTQKPQIKKVVGPSYNKLRYFPPVESGEFQEASIFGLAADLQKQANEAYEADQCDRPYGVPGMPIYTYVKGQPRAIEATYSPGDEHLHGTVGSLPEGADPDRKYFAFFNGQPYELPVRYYPDGMEGDRDSNLAFKIPEAVGHPDYIDYPCNDVGADSSNKG